MEADCNERTSAGRHSETLGSMKVLGSGCLRQVIVSYYARRVDEARPTLEGKWDTREQRGYSSETSSYTLQVCR